MTEIAITPAAPGWTAQVAQLEKDGTITHLDYPIALWRTVSVGNVLIDHYAEYLYEGQLVSTQMEHSSPGAVPVARSIVGPGQTYDREAAEKALLRRAALKATR